MFNWLRNTFATKRLDGSTENYPSVVVLLKEPNIRTTEDSLNLVRRALGNDTELQLISVLNNGNTHLIRYGKFFFTFHQAPQRYELPDYKPTDLIQKLWNEHTAWIAFDLSGQTSEKLRELDSLGTVYKTLLVFAFLCWSPNCLWLISRRKSLPCQTSAI